MGEKITIEMQRQLRDNIEQELNTWAAKKLKSSVNDRSFLDYLNYLFKRISKRKRKVFCSKEFSVENKNGFERLKIAFENGDDVNSFLSRGTKIDNADKVDEMLAYYNLHHFHLGESNEPDGYVKRTGEIAIAFVTDDVVFFVQTTQHGKGYSDIWFQTTNYLNIILDERPDLLEQFRFKLSTAASFIPSDGNEKKELQRNNICYSIQLADQNYYFPANIGTALDGTPIVVSWALTSIRWSLFNWLAGLGDSSFLLLTKDNFNELIPFKINDLEISWLDKLDLCTLDKLCLVFDNNKQVNFVLK